MPGPKFENAGVLEAAAWLCEVTDWLEPKFENANVSDTLDWLWVVIDVLELPRSEDIIEEDVLDVEKLNAVGANGIEVDVDGAEPEDIEEDVLIAGSLDDMELEVLGLDCSTVDEDVTGTTLMTMGDEGAEVELVSLFWLTLDIVLEDIEVEVELEEAGNTDIDALN